MKIEWHGMTCRIVGSKLCAIVARAQTSHNDTKDFPG
jgi:hypothetical protein